MILTPLILFAAAPLPGTASAKSAWESCLQSFAQVASLGSGSEFTIATSALAACSMDRDRYAKALIREAGSASADSQTPVSQAQQQLPLDQRELMIRLIAFIRRIRQA